MLTSAISFIIASDFKGSVSGHGQNMYGNTCKEYRYEYNSYESEMPYIMDIAANFSFLLRDSENSNDRHTFYVLLPES